MKKIEPCPFCGGKCQTFMRALVVGVGIECRECYYKSGMQASVDAAVQMHNFVSRTVQEARKLEEDRRVMCENLDEAFKDVKP